MCYAAASRAMVCWARLPCQRALYCATKEIGGRAACHESGWLREQTLDAPPQKKARPTGTAQAQRGEVVDVNVEEKTDGQCEMFVCERERRDDPAKARTQISPANSLLSLAFESECP